MLPAGGRALPPSAGGGAVLQRVRSFAAVGHWPHALLLAVLLTAVVGARAHEAMPLVPKIRPALLLTYIVAPLAIMGTSAMVSRRVLRDRLYQLVIGYVVWIGVTVLFSIWKGVAITTFQGMIPILVLMFVIMTVPSTPQAIDRLQAGFVAGCLVTAVGALVFGYEIEGRLSTTASLDANDLAGVMSMAIALAFGLLARARKWWHRALWAACMLVLVLTFTRTGSRGGFLAVAVSTVVFVAGQPGRRRIGFMALAAVAAFGAWQGANDTFRRRITSFVQGEEDYNVTEFTGRKMVWARARGYTLQYPVFGVGAGNFPIKEGETCRELFPDRGCKWSVTHNAYLQASSELGIPGLGIFAAILLLGARRALRLWMPSLALRDKAWHRPELLAALVGFAVSATFLSHAYFALAFALLAMIGVASRQPQVAPTTSRGPNPPMPGLGAPVLRRRPGMRGGLARTPQAWGA